MEYQKSIQTSVSTKLSLSSQASSKRVIPQRNSKAFSIFIGCLPQRISHEDLVTHFSSYGLVLKLEIEQKTSSDESSTLINAYLECSTAPMMNAILSNPQIIDGNNIKVAKYMTKEELENYVEKSRRCRIYIKRLPMHFNNESLAALFSQYGRVTKAYCVSGTKARKNLKYGYVLFDEEETINLLPISGVPFMNSKLHWTCHKHKIQKRKMREHNNVQYSQSRNTQNCYSIPNQIQFNNFNNMMGIPTPYYNQMNTMPQQNHYYEDDCYTLAPEDERYYQSLSQSKMFENADYHSVKPTSVNY